MSKRLPVYNFADVPKETKLHQGRMTRYSIRTKHAQIVFATIKPQPKSEQKYHRAPHDHPHDMMLVVVKGKMHMEIGKEIYELPEGAAVVIPAFVMHRGYAMGDQPVQIMEVFAPARADYIHLVEYQKEDFGDKGVPWVKKDLDSWNPPPA